MFLRRSDSKKWSSAKRLVRNYNFPRKFCMWEHWDWLFHDRRGQEEGADGYMPTEKVVWNQRVDGNFMREH